MQARNKDKLFSKAHAELLILNIAKAANASNNYPSAWRLWKGWADLIIPASYWDTEAGTEFLSQAKRNLQSMTALKKI